MRAMKFLHVRVRVRGRIMVYPGPSSLSPSLSRVPHLIVSIDWCLSLFLVRSYRLFRSYLVRFSQSLIVHLLFSFFLQSAGLLKAFGSLDLDVVPAKTRDMSPEKLMDLIGMNVQNLAPGRPTGSWAAAVRWHNLAAMGRWV